MPGVVESLYPSSSMIVAIRRQSVAGTPATKDLIQIKGSQINPKTMFNMSDPGIEIGTGSDNEQPQVKEAFLPALELSGHLRAGALPLNLVSASRYAFVAVGTPPVAPVNTNLSALATRQTNSITVASATGLVVGDWIQIDDVATPGVFVPTDRPEVHEIKTIAGNVITLKTNLLYGHPNTTTVVKKVRNDQKVQHRGFHMPLSAASLGSTDLWTAYIYFVNGDGTVVQWIFYDGKVDNFSTPFATGTLPGYQSTIKFRRVTRDPTILATVNYIPDPSSVLFNNTRGSSQILGDTVNHPRQINISLSTPIQDDLVLNSLFRDSMVQLSHNLQATSNGKFLKALFDQIVWNGAGNIDVSDLVPEGIFQYIAQSARLIGTSTTDNYSFGWLFPRGQYYGYDAQAQGGGMIESGVEGIRALADFGTEIESFVCSVDNLTTSGVYASAT